MHSSAADIDNAGGNGLRGSLGVGAIVLMVVATAAPLTVMVANTPLIIAMGNGTAAPFDALVGTVIMLLFTVGFVAMSPHITNAGAFYAYIQKGLGRVIGLGSATMALTSYFFILIALEAYMGFALSEALRGLLGVAMPWQMLSLATVTVVGMLGYRDVELSSHFLGCALVLEIGVVVLVNIAVIAAHAGNGLDLTPVSAAAARSGSPGLGIMFALYSFVGFEATVVFREEARDPDRTIPRATYAAVLLIGVFYVVSMWCEVVGVGTGRIARFAAEHPSDLYPLLARHYVGRGIGDAIQLLLITSLFACILSMHNIVVRYQYVLGRYGVLHRALSLVHARHGSPHLSSLLQTATSFVAILLLQAMRLDPVTQIFAWGGTAGTLGYMAIVALTCVAVIAFFGRHRHGERLWNVCVAPGLALIGLLACLVIAIDNLPALIGGDDAVPAARALSLVVVLSFVAGCAAALLLKLRFSHRFEALRELA